MRKLSQEDFVSKANAKHGGRYSYSLARYSDKLTKVCIVCPEHGEFWQTPDNHYRYGCHPCGRVATGSAKRKAQAGFLASARKKHGEKYDYSKAIYAGAAAKVCVICPKHGEFWQGAASHANNGRGCQDCYDERRPSLDPLHKVTRFYCGTYRGTNFLSRRELFWMLDAERKGVAFVAIDQPGVRAEWRVAVVRDGRPGTYCADFYLPQRRLVIDVKPDWRVAKEAPILLQAKERYAERGFDFETVSCDDVPVDKKLFAEMVLSGEVTLFPKAMELFARRKP